MVTINMGKTFKERKIDAEMLEITEKYDAIESPTEDQVQRCRADFYRWAVARKELES